MTGGAVVSLSRTTRVERHHLAVVGARVELPQVRGLRAERAGRPARRRDTRGC